MFTGIVAALGRLADKHTKPAGDLAVRVHCPLLGLSDVQLGDSIAVNGICLTVTQLEQESFWADLSAETLKHSTFGQQALGSVVNLEKALRLGDRLGGHMVSGHVDAVATLSRMSQDASSLRLWLTPPQSLLRFIAVKGSVTLDGVSLTVNDCTSEAFSVNVVPHTAKHTLIGHYRLGQQIHLEVDLIARYLDALQGPKAQAQSSAISASWLAQHGFN